MLKPTRLLASFLSSIWILSGCGIVYTAVDVKPGLSSGVHVALVELTPLSVEEANSVPYDPPRLPAAFDLRARAEWGAAVFAASGTEARLPKSTGPAPYRIGAGDLLSVRADQEGMTPASALPVRDDGIIDLPRVGELRVEGLTVDEANRALSTFLEERRLDPVLTIEVEEFRARFVLIDGDVEAPGRVGLDTRPLTLDEAIISRGGRPTSSVAHLFRSGEVYTIPLSDRELSASLHLRHGDRVHVSGVHDADRAQFEARIALDAVDRPAVFITGEVQSPRRVPLPFDRVARLADVLFDEGGVPLRTGDYAAIYVLRLSPDPSRVTAYELDARNAAHLLMAMRFQLRPDDLIFVAEQKVTRINRLLSQLTPVLATTAGSGITSMQGN
jgi:polysaccharide export outer membrane protein